MSNFRKGATFTMNGEEYEVLTEGDNDPASCLIYAPLHCSTEPLSIRLWKEEAKLARGDITINGEDEATSPDQEFTLELPDPAARIIELKKRIRAIEKRRIVMRKSADPEGQTLLHDNIVRPNKPFDIWTYANHKNRHGRIIQFIKIQSIVIAITKGDDTERFLFNLAPNAMPNCRVGNGRIFLEGQVQINLNSQLQTIQGKNTRLIAFDPEWHLELLLALRLHCKATCGHALANANIIKASFAHNTNAPGLRLAMPSLLDASNSAIIVVGLGLDIYAEE